MNTRADFAKNKNAQGVNCAQAIALAYQDLVSVEPKYLYQMAEGFGGGMGQMRETCGLLTGLYLIVGLLFSDGDMEKGQTKSVTYEKVRSLHHAFKQEFGAVDCLELLHGEKPGFKKCHDKFPAPAKSSRRFSPKTTWNFPKIQVFFSINGTDHACRFMGRFTALGTSGAQHRHSDGLAL